MVDLDILKARGITPESLERNLKTDYNSLVGGAFVGQTVANLQDQGDNERKVANLRRRIRSRIQEGMDRNFRDFRTYYALDVAWDTPFRQINPTLLQNFLDQDPNQEDVYKQVESWGLSSLIEEKDDPKTGKKIKTFNYPVFFKVLVPLVRLYVTIRWAKIINDRRLNPFFKYEPLKNTAVLTAKCEALTDRINIISQQYGYFDVLKQAVLKMLHYSTCFQFPKEEWHYEEQLRPATEDDVRRGKKNDADQPASVGDNIRFTDREGLRYHLPHPTRVFYDLAHGPYTLNYDCGCEYVGYWRIARYREILNSNFWNKDQIALGSGDLISNNQLFFTTVYSACTLRMPTTPAMQAPTPDGNALAAEIGVGSGNLDREKEIGNLYYGTEHGDQGVLVTEYFEKLIPSENGLGNYDHPVWFRFVIAGDQATILYAAPVPYCPVIYYGYDADESRTKNASMSMEVMPFQDQFSNVLTQIILTAKQNLANLTFVDEDQVDQPTLDTIKGIGEKLYRYLNVFKYSSKKAARMQQKLADAVQSFALPKGNVAELIMVLKSILDVLERVLVMSSQEVAQAASHELRVDEVRNIMQSTSARLIFSATPVDIACMAWKRQLYQGLMAFGDDDIYTMIPSDTPLEQSVLEAMGFTFVDRDMTNQDRYVQARIAKNRLALPLWSFASTRDNEDRTDNFRIAQTMGQLLQNMLNNPMLAQAIGPDQAIDLSNVLWKLAGLPPDRKLRNTMPPQASPEEQQQQAQAELKQVVQIVLGEVNKNMQKELVPLMDAIKEHGQEINLLFRALQIPVPPHPANDSDISAPTNGSPSNRIAGMVAPASMPGMP